MSLRSMLTDTCTINRKTEAVSGTSKYAAVSVAAVASSVPCLVQSDNSREAMVARSERGVARYRVYFEYGTDINNGDTLTWRSRTLSVISVPVDDSGKLAYAKVIAEEITGGLSA